MSRKIVEDVIRDYEAIVKILQNRITQLKAEHNISSVDTKSVVSQQRNEIMSSIANMREEIMSKVAANTQSFGSGVPHMPSAMSGVPHRRSMAGMPDMSAALRNVPAEQREKIEEQMRKAKEDMAAKKD